MHKKKVLIHQAIASIVIFVISFISIVIFKQIFSGPYYKSPDIQYNDLTSISQKEIWKFNDSSPLVLLGGKKITGNFIAKSDNLGIIAIPFDTHKQSIEDKIVFRLKETSNKNWYYQGTYNTNQIQHNIPFPFGFPVVRNSKNIAYTFELESFSGTRNKSLSIIREDSHFYSKYKFSKTELLNNPFTLMQFIVAKTKEQLATLTLNEIIFIIFMSVLPFILEPLLKFSILFDKKIISLLNRNKINHEFTIDVLSFIYNYIKKIIKFLISLIKNIFLLSLDRDGKIKLASLIICIGFFISIFYHYIQTGYYKHSYPLSSFLPTGFFGDFTLYTSWSQYQFKGIGYAFSYFPGMYLSIDLLNKVFGANLFNATIFIISFFTIFLFIFAYKNVKTKSVLDSCKNAFILSVMTYPFLFTIQTANPEIITFLFVSFFFIFYKSNRLLSITSLAYATSMKLFPGILIFLLLIEKRYKDLILTCLFTFLFLIMPLVIFDGGFNTGINNYFSRLTASQKMYSDLMITGGSGNHYGHSLLNGLRALFATSFPPMEQVILPYTIFIIIMTILIIIYLRFFEKIFWKKVACLIMTMNLFPYTSTDYKLLYIFIPLFLFINYPKKEKSDTIFTILFSSLLISKDYLYVYNNPLLSFNVFGNAAIMLVILLIIIVMGHNFSKIKKVY